MIHTCIDSPVGPLTLAGSADGTLSHLHFGESSLGEHAPDAFPVVRRQLAEYFSGERRSFDLSLALTGSVWERRVWAQLQRIPYGQTRTYGEIAVAAGAPAGAARAVGSANNHNPVAIVVPCHRVIGADGRLVGFAGGLDTKRRLLDLEAGLFALV